MVHLIGAVIFFAECSKYILSLSLSLSLFMYIYIYNIKQPKNLPYIFFGPYLDAGALIVAPWPDVWLR